MNSVGSHISCQQYFCYDNICLHAKFGEVLSNHSMAVTLCRRTRRSNTCYSALSRHCHRRGAQVHGAHQAASYIPALYLPSRSRYSFTDPERMEGRVSPGPWCKEQQAHGCYGTARSLRDSNPRPRGRWSSTLTTRLSRHPVYYQHGGFDLEL